LRTSVTDIALPEGFVIGLRVLGPLRFLIQRKGCHRRSHGSEDASDALERSIGINEDFVRQLIELNKEKIEKK
jgi:hypothetical protein